MHGAVLVGFKLHTKVVSLPECSFQHKVAKFAQFFDKEKSRENV